MTRHFPLSAKILLWFVLNLVILAVLFAAVLRTQFHLGSQWLLSGANERIDTLGDIIIEELEHEPRAEWSATLQRFDLAYQNKVRFLMFDDEGAQLAGTIVEVPPEVHERLALPHPPGPPHERDFESGPPPDGRPPGPGPRPKIMIRAGDPSRYWMILRAALRGPEGPPPERVSLVMVAQSLSAGGLFFDVRPWIVFGVAAVALSALLWFPLVRGINRAIAQMTDATQQIAAGRFQTRVEERRRDELGALGSAINQMAERLDSLVGGQKRFLGDIAHELCSPLAKLRVSLGILEQRARPEHKAYVAQAEDEAAHMASLVNELLSFSKASLGASTLQLCAVNVRDTVERAVRREAPPEISIRQDIPRELTVLADGELLTRAISNLLRNAVRYAGASGEIAISGRQEERDVLITIADQGPGVAESELSRLFDPFYRVEESRDRATGGVGLGLAIVKTCVESCGGAVQCRNRIPTGLEVVIRLPASGLEGDPYL